MKHQSTIWFQQKLISKLKIPIKHKNQNYMRKVLLSLLVLVSAINSMAQNNAAWLRYIKQMALAN